MVYSRNSNSRKSLSPERKGSRPRSHMHERRGPGHRSMHDGKFPQERLQSERKREGSSRRRSWSRLERRPSGNRNGNDSHNIPPLLDRVTEQYLRRARWRKNRARMRRLQKIQGGPPANHRSRRGPDSGGNSAGRSSDARRSSGVTRGMRMDNYAAPRSRRSPPARRNDIDHTMVKARKEASKRTKDVFWTKKLLEAESTHPNRWAHSGFKEMYRDELGFIENEDQGKVRRSPVSPPRSKNNLISKNRSGKSADAKRRLSPIVDSRISKMRKSSSPKRRIAPRPRRTQSPRRHGSPTPGMSRGGLHSFDGQRRPRSRGRRSPRRSPVSHTSSSSVSSITSRSGSGSVSGSSYSSYSRSSYSSSYSGSSRSGSRSLSSSGSISSVFSVSPPPSTAVKNKTPGVVASRSIESTQLNRKVSQGQKIVDAAKSVKPRRNNLNNVTKKLKNVRPIDHTSKNGRDASSIPVSDRPPDIIEIPPENEGQKNDQRASPRRVLKVDRVHIKTDKHLLTSQGKSPPVMVRHSPLEAKRAVRPPVVLSEGERTPTDTSSDEEEEGELRMTLSERFGKLAQLSSQRQEYDGVRMKIVREGGQDKKVYMEGAPHSPSPPRIRQTGGAHERWLLENKAEYDEYESRYGEFRQWDPHRDLPRELPPNWDDVTVRYRYYKESGYFGDRSLSMDDYLKWEQWWYRYRDWLEKYGDLEDRGGYQPMGSASVFDRHRVNDMREEWMRRPDHRKRHSRY